MTKSIFFKIKKALVVTLAAGMIMTSYTPANVVKAASSSSSTVAQVSSVTIESGSWTVSGSG
ncbi:MAG: hypothetical protein K6F84_07790, partial [Lachnospiraceae bacterium]|nr:hypothetical protein [Lachnospiraceae bacterium]